MQYCLLFLTTIWDKTYTGRIPNTLSLGIIIYKTDIRNKNLKTKTGTTLHMYNVLFDVIV